MSKVCNAQAEDCVFVGFEHTLLCPPLNYTDWKSNVSLLIRNSSVLLLLETVVVPSETLQNSMCRDRHNSTAHVHNGRVREPSHKSCEKPLPVVWLSLSGRLGVA